MHETQAVKARSPFGPTALALSLGFVVSACAKEKSSAKPPSKPSHSTRAPISDLPVGPDEGDEDKTAATTEPSSARGSIDLLLSEEIVDVDAAKRALQTLWPDVIVSCWSLEGCFQRGDLDADGKPDALVMIKHDCGEPSCAVGVAVLSSRGKQLRLGAGLDPALPWVDWELNERDEPVWQAAMFEGKPELARTGADWEGTVGVAISPAAAQTACAGAMKLGHDALVIEGTDATGALVWREGWMLTACGY